MKLNFTKKSDLTETLSVRISLKTKKLNACLKIQDSGMGMTDEVKTRLFEPFHTTKAKGTGLGLAMVHKILDNHQASINVDSKSGEGTTFKINFPLL